MRPLNRKLLSLIPAAGLLFAVGAAANGAIVGTDGLVTTRVQEQLNGEPGSVTSDEQSLSDAGAAFPLSAAAGLNSTDLTGVIVSLAEGLSRMADPTRLDEPNPQEFGLEAACYSDAESVSYVVTSEAEETRTVLFTTAGNPAAPPEIDFGFGSTADVESRVFLSGAVVVWSKSSDTPLDDVLATLTVQVARSDTGSVLFSSGVTVSGTGTSVSDAATTGPVVVQRADLAELASLGLDSASLTILQSVADSGTLAVYVIPQQEHVYQYTVTADEPLDLVASLAANVQNAPAGTGIAATWGGPFTNLVDFADRGLPGVDGQALQSAVNKAIEAGIPDETGQVRMPLSLPCGAFGLASLFFLAFAWPTLRAGRAAVHGH